MTSIRQVNNKFKRCVAQIALTRCLKASFCKETLQTASSFPVEGGPNIPLNRFFWNYLWILYLILLEQFFCPARLTLAFSPHRKVTSVRSARLRFDFHFANFLCCYAGTDFHENLTLDFLKPGSLEAVYGNICLGNVTRKFCEQTRISAWHVDSTADCGHCSETVFRKASA